MKRSLDLAKMVYECLSRPPSRVGCRMRPERELAQAFGISRRKVREAVENLVEAQILVREQGSGVYVRKVPPPVPDAEGEGVTFESLFVVEENGERRPRLQLPPDKRALALEVWWKTAFNNQTADLFRQGLLDQAASLGHTLRFNELPSGEAAEDVASKILAEVGKRHCDGYIIHVPFVYACDYIDSLLSAPVMYVSTGLQPLRHQPMIRFDGNEAIHRAVELLAGQGYRRIGVLGFRPDHEISGGDTRKARSYQAAIEELGLGFERFEDVPMTPARVREALHRLLQGKPSCDALYLTDDHLLHMAMPIITELGFTPGENLGMIVLSNRGISLPEGHEWSRMEFDPYNNGKLAIQCLIRSVESAGEEMLSFSHHPAWRPGRTHLFPGPKTRN